MEHDNRQQIINLAEAIKNNAENGDYNPDSVQAMAHSIELLAWDDAGFPPFGQAGKRAGGAGKSRGETGTGSD